MQCPKCNTVFDDNLDICPNCNLKLNDEDLDIIEISEEMNPPKLNAVNENINKDVQDINEIQNIDSFEKVEETKELTPENNTDITISDISENEDKGSQKLNDLPNNSIKDSKKFSFKKLTSNLNKINLKSNKKISLPVVIGICIGVLIIGLFLGKILFSRNYCATTNSNSLVGNKIKYVSDGKNNITNVNSYTYKIPDGYVYDKSNNGLIIMDKNDLWRIFIYTESGSYTDLTGAKTSIRESLKANNLNVLNSKELNILNVNVLAFETEYKNTNRLMAFIDASNDFVYYIEIVTHDNNFNYDVLNIAVDIAKNATYEERTSNMEKIDINNMANLAIKASLEYKKLPKNN